MGIRSVPSHKGPNMNLINLTVQSKLNSLIMYKAEQITQDLLNDLQGRTVEIKYRHYSHHTHLTTRVGKVTKTDRGIPFVQCVEGVFADSIEQLTIVKAEIRKVFPIEGRTDFFKYVIIIDNEVQTDFEGKEMYFDSFALDRCVSTVEAINRVNEADTFFPIIRGTDAMDQTPFYKWLESQAYELPKFVEAIKLYTGLNRPFVSRGDGTNHRYVFDYFWYNKLRS